MELPVISIRGRVLFPGQLLRLSIGKERSVALVEAELEPKFRARRGAVVGVFAQTGEGEEDGMFDVGTAARVVQLNRAVGGGGFAYSVVVQGVARVRLVETVAEDPFRVAAVERVPDVPLADADRVLTQSVLDAGRDLLAAARRLPRSGKPVVATTKDFASALGHSAPGKLADALAALLNVPVEAKQRVLETADVAERLGAVLKLLVAQRGAMEVSSDIHSRVQSELDSQGREFYLRQQLGAIRKELRELEGSGQIEDEEDEAAQLRAALDAAELPPEARRVADRELARLERMPPAHPEHSMVHAYLELLSQLPWTAAGSGPTTAAGVMEQLEADHYGLADVKRRIVEHVAVMQLNPEARSPILCLVGPPGVGKTSLGRSVATALGREFQRVSLGGVHDEATIRGHRRTYIGSMPGVVIQAVRRAGSREAVLLLDEVDKITRDGPASALLEVLDPEQNSTFADSYVNTPFDLSRVLFVCTANTVETIPAPLLDRMEVIELSGYTLDEKVQIAERYIVPRQLALHGLADAGVQIGADTLRLLATAYAREAGVRVLEQKVAALCRDLAVQLCAAAAPGSRSPLGAVTPENARAVLGRERFEDDEGALREPAVGLAAGLAWTPHGGRVLPVEASLLPGGSGQLLLTGQLGDVMQESARVALSWIRANAAAVERLVGAPPSALEGGDVHVHFPAGAVPKDGPSAGIALAVSLVSLATGRAPRAGLALTGELSLHGLVLPVGGVKEKVIAAHRAGVVDVVLPAGNKADVEDVPDVSLNYSFAERLEDVLGVAFSSSASASWRGADRCGPVVLSSL